MLEEKSTARQQADKLDHAAKVVAMCVPPVVMALLGLLLQSKESGRTSAVARGKGTSAIKAQGGSASIGHDRGNGKELQAPRDRKGGGRPCRGGAKLDSGCPKDHTFHCNR